MTVTARGAAVLVGALLAFSGALLLLESVRESPFLLVASGVLPFAWLAATIAASLDSDVPRTVRGHGHEIWPAYLGLVVCAAALGDAWIDLAGVNAGHENYAGLFLLVVMVLHLAAFSISGLVLLVVGFRSAGLHMWLGYVVLLVAWVVGGLVV